MAGQRAGLAHLARCEARIGRGPVGSLRLLHELAADLGLAGDIAPIAVALAQAFNHGTAARAALARAERQGDGAAADMRAWMDMQGLAPAPLRPISRPEAEALARMRRDAPDEHDRSGAPWALSVADRHWALDHDWARARLVSGRARLARMTDLRGADVAVLVGNGPSLARTDPGCLVGADVFVSNYALRHPGLARLARGVAVSNHFVAAQATQLFHPLFHERPLWRVLPVWLGGEITDDPMTIWLDAQGGDLFLSEDPARRIAWHATVSYLWMQILLAQGYRRIVLVGFDHGYRQPAGLPEGAVIVQQGDDANHFDPGYFRGLRWQAADVDHMAAAYRLARARAEQLGVEIVNCTEGGALEVFARGALADVMGSPRARGGQAKASAMSG